MKKNEKRISAAEFDRRFDNGEDVSEYLDYENAITLEELLNQEKVTLTLSRSLMEKLAQKSKELDMNITDTIKAILAKELGII